ncbi:DUF5946 family protein [Micromonospora sp. KC721]|uniref:DUF5946 family protein n=1 Tax=Micromonospora sp. KC721 TaxID=2530380 RepID=UPI0010497393|nr:DUF5946 family protein [Micromonospora sp. KC721]TDB69403.1 hypothetical protein E1182_30050 [Micromonospora sp. KC721]
MTCAECGAPQIPRPCQDLFHELLALDHSGRAPWAPVHTVVVATFYLQHSSPVAAAGRATHWAILQMYLRDGLDALLAAARQAVRRNSHRFGGRRPTVDDYPGGPPFPVAAPAPGRFTTTIVDVAVDGTFPPDGHEDRVRRWAAATVAAWTAATDR